MVELRDRIDQLVHSSADFSMPIDSKDDSPSALQERIGALTGLLRNLDNVLFSIQPDETTDPAEARRMINILKGVRRGFYLLLVSFGPELESYWAPERQAQVRASDRELTPEVRQQILLESATAYAALKEDPAVWATLREEDALWDNTVADGLDGA